MSEKIKVANSDTFLDAFAALPKAQQRKTMAFLPKFRANPRSPGINYERINGANPDYRSVRIDQTYRCIVLAPKRGNTYVLLWVDHHDDAYDWAARKCVEINPTTGTLQIFETETIAAPDTVTKATTSADVVPGTIPARRAGDPSPAEPSAVETAVAGTSEAGAKIAPAPIAAPIPQPMPNGPPFALDEEQLRRIGVPEPLLVPVLALEDGPALEAMKRRLPVEAYEALALYGYGLDWEEILVEFASDVTGPVDTDDIDAALARDGSRRRFHVVESDSDLEAMLAAPLEKWRVYLHPSQRKLVERDWNGPVRVTGGAGTGKTVVAMHRAAWLVRQLAESDEGRDGDEPRILFLTYNVNLAADIAESLRSLVTPEAFAHIEVTNIDAWASRFLKARGHQRQIRYEGGLDELWDEVLDLSMPELENPLPRSFYLEEWERVVQPNRILDRDAYLRISRAGRGVALSRRQRAAVWDVFDAMRGELARRGWQTWSDAMLDAADELTSASRPLGYRHVIVDETQDMGPEALRLIRAIVPAGPNDLFFVGDGHQRIYRRRAVMGQCGIKIVGRSRKLKINYRTTEEIRRFASAVLQGIDIDDLDDGDDTGPGYLSLTRGPVPVFVPAESQAGEIGAIARRLRAIVDAGGELRDCCVMLRTVALRDRYFEALRAEGLEAVLLQRRADNRKVPGVRVCNMHRVKGLEFRHVVIASVRDGVVPNRQAIAGSEDRTELRDRDLAERALLHVCASRAIESLTVTWHGAASEYVPVADV